MNKLLNLNLEQKEWKKVQVFTLESFFLGVFIATLEISSTSLFLDTFDESQLPLAFILSGVLGFLMTSAFSWLQGRINYQSLVVSSFLFLIFLLLLLRFGFDLFPGTELIYLTFVLMGPFKVLGFLAFWGMASRIFSLRQGKRLFGLIDAGQVLGAIIIGFSTSFLIYLFGSTENLLLLAAGSLILALLVQRSISAYYKEFRESIKENTRATASEKRQVWKSPYVRNMVLFVVLSTLSVFFVYNSFLSVTKVQFPNQEDLANFIGFFLSTVMVFSFLFKTFVYSRLMQTYGLRVVLMVLPILLLFFTFGAVSLGSLFGIGSGATGEISFFFIMIALSQLFSQSLKNSLEIPAFKILYQPIAQNVRYDVQARIDGSINEASAVLAGALLLGLGQLPFSGMLFFGYILIGILIIWAWSTFKLHKLYRNILKESLSKGADLLHSIGFSIGGAVSFFDNIAQENPGSAQLWLSFLRKSNKNLYIQKVIQLLGSDSEAVRKIAEKHLENEPLVEFIPDIERLLKGNDSTITKAIKEVADSNKSLESIRALVQSRDPNSRVLAVHLIAQNKAETFHKEYRNLLKDFHPQVRRTALAVMPSLNWPEFWPRLVEHLELVSYHETAKSAILEIGERILPTLEQFFYKSGYSYNMSAQIIQIFGLMGNDEASKYLVKKVTHPDNRIVRDALKALRKTGYQPTEQERGRLKGVLEKAIHRSLWFESALEILYFDDRFPLLFEALKQEEKESREFLFQLLAILYEPESVAYVKQNLESGSPESSDYAVELLDLFLDEDLKGKLFPLIEDYPVNLKRRFLEAFFPIEINSPDDVLIKVLDFDFTYTNRWTKAIALKYLDKIESDYMDQVIALAFHPDSFLSESALQILSKIDGQKFEEVVNRMGIKKAHEIKQQMGLAESGIRPSKFDLALELSEQPFFNRIPKKFVIDLIDKCRFFRFGKGDVLDEFEFGPLDLVYVHHGSFVLNGKEETSPKLLGKLVDFPIEGNSSISPSSNGSLFYFSGQSWFSLMDLYPDFFLAQEPWLRNQIIHQTL